MIEAILIVLFIVVISAFNEDDEKQNLKELEKRFMKRATEENK